MHSFLQSWFTAQVFVTRFILSLEKIKANQSRHCTKPSESIQMTRESQSNNECAFKNMVFLALPLQKLYWALHFLANQRGVSMCVSFWVLYLHHEFLLLQDTYCCIEDLLLFWFLFGIIYLANRICPKLTPVGCMIVKSDVLMLLSLILQSYLVFHSVLFDSITKITNEAFVVVFFICFSNFFNLSNWEHICNINVMDWQVLIALV